MAAATGKKVMMPARSLPKRIASKVKIEKAYRDNDTLPRLKSSGSVMIEMASPRTMLWSVPLVRISKHNRAAAAMKPIGRSFMSGLSCSLLSDVMKLISRICGGNRANSLNVLALETSKYFAHRRLAADSASVVPTNMAVLVDILGFSLPRR